MEQIDGNKNPGDVFGNTPLHEAAKNGHFDVCELILPLVHVDDKNPKDGEGMTPLHCAASGLHSNICRLITNEIEDKHPVNDDGETPKKLWKDASRNLVRELW